MFFDPLYLVFMVPAMLLAGWAQWRVTSAFRKYSEVGTRAGMTGADVAHAILDAEGIRDVRVEPVEGFLSDHYDSRGKVLRLSPQNYYGRSVAAAGIAAHEVGHAIQHARRYVFLEMRQTLAPVASIGSSLSWILLIGGMVLQAANLVYLGIAAFALAVVFTLITLPVEFDASKRAKQTLAGMGLITRTEGQGVAAVLNAAALTYVAAAVTAVLQLVYWLLRAGVLGGSRE